LSASLPPAAISVGGLRVVRSGAPVLDGLSLDVAAGAVTGLVGPSGGGKSTLMRAIVGVQQVSGGRISVLGEPAGSPSLRKRVAYMTQGLSIYSDLSVRENLGYFARLYGVSAGRVDELIETVSLGGFEGRVVARLSGGQRARVSLAGALIGEPELLVLDEPTVGLDPLLRRELWELFHRLAGEGKTLVVSSHVMDEAERCDDLLLLRDGRLIATGTPDELRVRTGEQGLDAVFLRLVDEDR
jgi:ABC-type multidrug transport system ATPase subunit